MLTADGGSNQSPNLINNHNITRPVFAVKHVHFKHWPSHFKKHDKNVISFQNVTYESLDDIYCSARPHRSRAITAYLQSEAVTSVPWPAMSPDLNPRAYLGHVRPSYTGSGTSGAKHSSVGSSITSGMAATITTGLQIRAHGWPRNRSHGFDLEVGGYCSWMMRPDIVISTWGLHPVLNFEQYMSSSDS
jgi:hypothetical protein